jgi:hypothetical protein
MSGYVHKSDEFELSWHATYPADFRFDKNEVENVNNATLNFQTFQGMYEEDINNPTNEPGVSYLGPVVSSEGSCGAYTRTFSSAESYGTQCDFEEEPPLLEELGISPTRIFEKSLAVLNPFRTGRTFDVNLLHETDFAGPAALCVLLGSCLLLAGGKVPFGYVYGLVMMSCFAMYVLLTLMTTEGSVTLGSVASVLGYCLLPIVILSAFGVFLPLYSSLGFVCAVLAVMWSSLAASKLFVMMLGDTQQRPLIAYPCTLLYGTFALIVVF